MTWALVLGGAANVYDDMHAALRLFGEPDVYVGVKDIGWEHPKVTHWCSYHVDRIPRELEKRRSLGYPDPERIWTYKGVRAPKMQVPVYFHKVRGGSSGLLGAYVGTIVAERAVLCGIPMDMDMPHYHMRKHGKAWKEGRLYKPHWQSAESELKNKVKSMSGWTKELLGEPSWEWVHGRPRTDAGSKATQVHPDTGVAP